MTLNWYQSVLFGFLSGLTEFFPVSSEAHQALFCVLTGKSVDEWMRLSVRMGGLLALFLVFAPVLTRYRREKKIAALPKRKRNRQPDHETLSEIHMLKTAMIVMFVMFLGYSLVYDLYERLWLLSILMGFNGIVLLLPEYLSGANKTAQSLSALDSTVVGIGAGMGIVPGFSRLAFSSSVGRILGVEPRYAVDVGLLLSIPATVIQMVIHIFAGFGAGASISAISVLLYITGGAASFCGAFVAISIIRFLAVRTGISGFAYYCWGFAMFSLIIYLF